MKFNENLIGTIECRDVLYNKFKNRWYKEYLLSLRSNHYNNNAYATVKNSPFLKEGSVVLLKNPVKSKPFWNIAKIVKITPSSDEHIRSVTVKKGDGSTTTTSVINLYPLELFAPVPDVDATPPSNPSSSEPPSVDEIHELNDVNPQTADEEADIASDSGPDDSNIEVENYDSNARRLRRAATAFRNRMKGWVAGGLL